MGNGDYLSSHKVVQSVDRAGVDEAVSNPQPCLHNLLNFTQDLEIGQTKCWSDGGGVERGFGTACSQYNTYTILIKQRPGGVEVVLDAGVNIQLETKGARKCLPAMTFQSVNSFLEDLWP